MKLQIFSVIVRFATLLTSPLTKTLTVSSDSSILSLTAVKTASADNSPELITSLLGVIIKSSPSVAELAGSTTSSTSTFRGEVEVKPTVMVA